MARRHVTATMKLVKGVSDAELIEVFAEVYVELRERKLPLAPFMLDETQPVDEEMTEDDLHRIAAYWNAYIDCRPGWMNEQCHNISAEEVNEMVDLCHLATQQGKRWPR